MDCELTDRCQGKPWKNERIYFGADFVPENSNCLSRHQAIEGAGEKISQYHHDDVNIFVMHKYADTAAYQQWRVKDGHYCFEG